MHKLIYNLILVDRLMEVIDMAESQLVMERTARQWVGQLVCVAHKDGSYYVGKVMEVKKGELVLAGVKGDRRIKGRKKLKGHANVSGLLGNLIGGFGMIRPLLGGAGLFRGGGGKATRSSGGGLGSVGKIWSNIRIGFRMVKFIWPLFSKL